MNTGTMTRPVAYMTIFVLLLTGLVFMPTTAHAASNVNNPQQVQDMFNRLNDFRKSKGLKAVKYNTNVESVARSWSVKMADSGNFVHNPSYARDSRIPNGWRQAGEIIAYNWDSSVPKMMDQWKNSPGHNAIMSGSGYTHVGIGLAESSDGRFYGTINFFRYENDPAGTKTNPGGGYTTKGAIGTKYNSVKNRIGVPTMNERNITGGAYQDFKNGTIYWKKNLGAHAVYNGDIKNRFKTIGSEKRSRLPKSRRKKHQRWKIPNI